MQNTCNASCSSCCGCVNRIETEDEEQTAPFAGGIPLAMMKDGGYGKIVRIAGRTELRRYLSNLGFVVGTGVSIVNTISGNLLLEVKGSRIAMDKSMASKVFIVPEGS